MDSSIVGKRVVGSVDAGLGFNIDTKVSVNGSPQYKVHNNKEKAYYVTANEAYVYVKCFFDKRIVL
ncbi:hypothetical protein COF76_08205 [Bacillus wiedmannii]|nr:hypothetical protein [Bacillus wiedmannii]MCU5497591.1 hypothetical protein [Bacillus wiedmannii]PFZ03949.1 hypothetical protein COL75_10845 [Bacillus wiedmannii]PHF00550.1 hypothetical protein COF76_08205 [Bacillus wiedmannii]